MQRTQTWRWLPAALLLATGVTAGRADDLRISSLDARSNLVFRTADTSCADHHYRVECATSLMSAAWAAVRTVGGVDAGTCVTNGAPMDTTCAFYRVVATSNSNVFVDGDYMVVDISGGMDATSYAVSYFASTSAVPGGIDSDDYKTTKILMRRIPAGTFTMASPANEPGRYLVETQHQVTLTSNFYLDVFEVTQRQWELVMGNNPSYFTNATCYQTRPVEQVSYYEIRENPLPVINSYTKGSAISPNWPATNAVHANSFMGKLRAKTGLTGFDLPTESQLEYACRAGTTTALNSGCNLTNTYQDARMAAVGRYWHNGGSGRSAGCAPSAGTATVGSYMANAWGLYDTHGNVYEWCLDWYGTYPGMVSDPKGAASGGKGRGARGGSWYSYTGYCRSAYRFYFGPSFECGVLPDYGCYDLGFRVALAPSGQ